MKFQELYWKKWKMKRIYLDLRHLGLEKYAVMPQEKRLAFDYSNELKMGVPITPTALHIGWNKTDIKSSSKYMSCGECTSSPRWCK